VEWEKPTHRKIALESGDKRGWFSRHRLRKKRIPGRGKEETFGVVNGEGGAIDTQKHLMEKRDRKTHLKGGEISRCDEERQKAS